MIPAVVRGRRAWWTPLVVLAGLVYVPLLLTAPGQVVADTKTYLYLDPGRLLSRAVSMWDPHVGLGTVPHQQIGYLWPAGPYYWLMEHLGAPDWVAQRIWLGSILVVAGGGVLFLARTWRWRPPAATAAAFVYALSPFVLTLAARISVLLLPFAGLPWLLAFTVRALHSRGWRHAALFGLTVTTIGSVNATSVALVGLVPVLWILYEVFFTGDVTRARALTTVAKLGVITIAVNLWWIAGLSVQATNGIDVLRYTETAQVVADASNAPEILRGLGYWFFYGGDRLGPWIEPSVDYTQHLWLLGLTYLLPVLGLFALGVVRWRHRAFLVGMVLVGTIIAVGAHPWTSPSPVGALIKAFLLTDLGLAMRSLPRAVPLVALGLALGIGSLVGAMAEERLRRGVVAAVVVAALAYAALPPLWLRQMVPENLRRPEDIPQYWNEAAKYLDARSHDYRILEIPGIDFASYRWGNTVDPITPGLVDRPYAARELIPYGSDQSADLLKALDLRLQEQTMPERGLAPLARLMGASDVVVRNDLQYERYNTPRPRSLWELITGMPGLGTPRTFGVGVPNEAIPEAPLIDETHLAHDAGLPESPAVAAFPVADPVPIVRTHSDEQGVLLSGDGAGIVDAAIAGLLRGDELIRYSASVTDDPDFARNQLTGVRGLIVTDTNRKRGERWTTVRHTEGYTEQADGGILGTDRSDNRLEVVPDRPGTQTVAEHRGISVRATGYGNPITYTPEERPANAADGDITTAWRVAAFEDAVGQRIELTTPQPITTDRVQLLQPQTGEINRWITDVRLRFDGGDPVDVTLDDRSHAPPGQTVTFDERTFQTLSIEIRADTAGRRPGYGGLTSVGFAEIGLAGRTLQEVIRMPSDLLDAGGFRTLRYPLAIVQTRQRSVPTEVTRTDEEFSMTRALELPTTRGFGVRGTARLSARAPSTVLDALLGRGGLDVGSPVVTASATLPGGLADLPSNVLDGDPATRWTGAFDAAQGSSLRVDAPVPVTFDHLGLQLVDDDEHSLPTEATVTVDGSPVGTFALRARSAGGDLVQTDVDLGQAVTGSTVEVTFSEVEARTVISWYTEYPTVLPVSVAELQVGDPGTLTVAARPLTIDTGCRDDLVTLDGDPVPVRIQGDVATALAGQGLDLTDCVGGVTVSGGDHLFETAEGRRTGIDVDQLVWRSAAGGAPFALDVPILPEDHAATTHVEVLDQNDTTIHVRVDGARPGQPFWLVMGQSYNDGWELRASEATSDGPALVDGFANGYLVTPDQASFEATLRFVPQNRVDVGLLVSLVAVVAALALAVQPAPELHPLPIPRQEPLRRIRAFSYEGALPTRRDARIMGVVAGVVAAVLVTPLVGLAVGLVAGFATRREGWRALLTLLPSALLGFVALYIIGLQYRHHITPGLHWATDVDRLHPVALAAVVLLAVDVAIDRLWAHRSEFR